MTSLELRFNFPKEAETLSLRLLGTPKNRQQPVVPVKTSWWPLKRVAKMNQVRKGRLPVTAVIQSRQTLSRSQLPIRFPTFHLQPRTLPDQQAKHEFLHAFMC